MVGIKPASYYQSQIMGGYCGLPLAHLFAIINKLLFKSESKTKGW